MAEIRLTPVVEGTPGPPEVFIQASAPVSARDYIWIQTGIGPGGEDFTIWFEDKD